MGLEDVNSTISTAYTAVGMISSGTLSILITVVVFFAIIATLFLVYKNFRAIIYGAVVSGILFGIYKLSRWIGVSTAIENNYDPIICLAYILGFILISFIIGKILLRFKKIKEFDKSLTEPDIKK